MPRPSAIPKPRVWSRSFQRILLIPFLLAPAMALVVQLGRPAGEEPDPDSAIRTRTLGPYISGILATPGATEFECTVEEINAHLAQTLLNARKSTAARAVTGFKIKLASDQIHIHTSYLWKNHAFQLRASYRFDLKGGRLVWEPVSGQCGKVLLSKRWVNNLEGPMRKFLPFLKKERLLLGRVDQLRIDRSRVLFKFRAASPASPES